MRTICIGLFPGTLPAAQLAADHCDTSPAGRPVHLCIQLSRFKGLLMSHARQVQNCSAILTLAAVAVYGGVRNEPCPTSSELLRNSSLSRLRRIQCITAAMPTGSELLRNSSLSRLRRIQKEIPAVAGEQAPRSCRYFFLCMASFTRIYTHVTVRLFRLLH